MALCPSLLKKNFKINSIILENFINLDEQEKNLIFNWRNNIRINKWCYLNHIITKKKHEQFIQNLKREGNNFYWMVKTKNINLGVISMNEVNFIHKHAYLGIYANPELRGVGSILMNCLKEIAFKIAKLHTLKLEVFETNKHAIEFYKKHGFKEEGCLKEFVYRDGKWLDVIVMGLINKNV